MVSLVVILPLSSLVPLEPLRSHRSPLSLLRFGLPGHVISISGPSYEYIEKFKKEGGRSPQYYSGFAVFCSIFPDLFPELGAEVKVVVRKEFVRHSGGLTVRLDNSYRFFCDAFDCTWMTEVVIITVSKVTGLESEGQIFRPAKIRTFKGLARIDFCVDCDGFTGNEGDRIVVFAGLVFELNHIFLRFRSGSFPDLESSISGPFYRYIEKCWSPALF
jgi:hypothetical protein